MTSSSASNASTATRRASSATWLPPNGSAHERCAVKTAVARPRDKSQRLRSSARRRHGIRSAQDAAERWAADVLGVAFTKATRLLDRADGGSWTLRGAQHEGGDVPVIRSLCVWTTRDGKRRVIRLYKSWKNMHDRVAGTTKSGRGGMPIWAGLECGFADWPDFRAWALSHGYSKTRCSLDRERSTLGYIKSNLRWVTPLQNSTFANLCGLKKQRQLKRDAARRAGQQEWATA